MAKKKDEFDNLCKKVAKGKATKKQKERLKFLQEKKLQSIQFEFSSYSCDRIDKTLVSIEELSKKILKFLEITKKPDVNI